MTFASILTASINILYTIIKHTSIIKNIDLYGNLPKLSDKIRKRRMAVAEHNVRHPELVASGLVLWEPVHGKRNAGGRRTTYIDALKRDTGSRRQLK